MERKIKLSYDHLLLKLNEVLLQFSTLHFASCLLWEQLANDESRSLLSIKAYIMPNNKNSLTISGDRIIGFIQTHANGNENSFEIENTQLFKINAHFIRTKAINNCYDLILNYLEGLDSTKQSQIKGIVYRESWMKVLNMLRDNAAHVDSYGKEFGKELKWPHKTDQIQWEDIIIKKGDIGHLIEYNDVQIIRLINHCVNFFNDNRATLSAESI